MALGSAPVLRGDMPVDAKGLGNGIRFRAPGSAPGYLLANFNRQPRPANFDALGLGPGHTRLCAVADLLCLHLLNR